MAKKLIIPIDDHNDGITCTLYYTVRFKLTAVTDWTDLGIQYIQGAASPLAYYLEINNLEDDVSYDYEIVRHCCEGTFSVAAAGTIVTTP